MTGSLIELRCSSPAPPISPSQTVPGGAFATTTRHFTPIRASQRKPAGSLGIKGGSET